MEFKISDDKFVNYYDEKIATKFCKEFNDNLWFKYATLFGEDCIEVREYICKEPFLYASDFFEFFFINNLNFSIKAKYFLKHKKEKEESKKLLYRIFNKNKKLLGFKINSTNFFYDNEIINFLYNNNLLKEENDNLILGYSIYNFSDIEALKYFGKKFKIKFNNDVNIYNLIRRTKENKNNKYFIDFQKEVYKEIKKDIENINFIDYFPSLDLINQNKKYDNIISNLKNDYSITPNFEEINNINLKYFSLLIGVFNLKKGGNLIIKSTLINKKITCDIILIFSQFFETYHLYEYEIRHKISLGGIGIIFSNFKDNLNDKKKLQIKTIFKKMLEINPTSNNFNITYRGLRERFNIWKVMRIDDTYKYPCSLLKNDVTDKKYEEFRKFNLNFYKKKIDKLNNLIELKKKKIKINSDLRNEQLVNSILYARKFNLKIIKLKKQEKIELNYEINNNLLNIYYHKKFEINKNLIKNSNKISIDNNELITHMNDYTFDLFTLNSQINDINKKAIYKMKNTIFYPGYMEYELIKFLNEKYNLDINFKIYSDWINLFEIISLYKIKYDNALHFCTNYNETIKVFDNSNLLLKSKNNHKHDILNSNNTNKNKRIRKKYSLFIGNCTNNKNLPTTNFSYFIKDSDINQIKLNYKGDYNVVTIYYNSGKFIFGSAKLAKKLGYTKNQFINQVNKEHQMNWHKNKNIDILHAHIKVHKSKEEDFLTNLFEHAGLDVNYNLNNLKKSKLFFKNNPSEMKIEFRDGYYSENILEKVKVDFSKNINLAYKKVYIDNAINMLKYLAKDGTGIIIWSLPLKYEIELELLEIFFNKFKKVSFYKPSNNTHLNEYFIICEKYVPIKFNEELLENKSKITKKSLEKYKNIIEKIKNLYNNIYDVYKNVVNELILLNNFQDEILENNDLIEKLIKKKNEEWVKTFI